MIAEKSHVFFGQNFHDFLFYAMFLPSKSPYDRKLCERKPQPKKLNDSRKIACFFCRWRLSWFSFFMQRFCPVNHVLIASYASVKRNQKSVMTAEESHVFFSVKISIIFFFMPRFCPVNHLLIANYASVKRNPRSAMTAGKSHVLFVSENFHDFPFLYNVFA